MTFNYLDFFATMNNIDFLNYLFEIKLIKDNVSCDHCLSSMALKNSKNNKFGKAWRCSNKNCEKRQTFKSIFLSSFFEGKKLDARMTLKIIYYLACNTLIVDIVAFTKVGYNTITGIKKSIQTIINEHWSSNPIMLGGPEVNVQIDETKLNYNVKAHRGRSPRSPVWAITMVDTRTTPAKGYAEIVESRDANTLLPIISRVVRAGSNISTDQWPSYNSLGSINDYNHGTVCHKYHFVDPVTQIHTQNLESYNNKLKYDIKKRKGIRNDLKSDFLKFFMFIDHYKENAFSKLLELLKHN